VSFHALSRTLIPETELLQRSEFQESRRWMNMDTGERRGAPTGRWRFQSELAETRRSGAFR
jgi:hypothetical protein